MIKQEKTQNCGDKKCPFHGDLKIRGRTFVGNIIKKDVHGTATVEWKRLFFITKYERYEKRRTKIRVHNPKCISTKIGDKVRINECRPISKTKHFVIMGVIK